MKYSCKLPHKLILFAFALLLFGNQQILSKEGFVKTSGKSIVDQNGNNLIFRGIGTGNWMLQEGYMMNSSDIAPTMWKFRELLTNNIGEEKTSEFYQKWYDTHFTEIDVDSMAQWGFNCVRVALHYKMFTLPIEEEPVIGEQTWLNEGFNRLDNLYNWCAKNQIYLILDMHGCPGGQGTDGAISDYNDTKPSLWESDANKDKLVALWRRLAERYATCEWIGGYDLINETNWWNFSEPNNKPLRDLMIRITNTIREVDQNHIVFIEGNSWANDFNGLTPKWDNNMVYSFHKYWTYNDIGSLEWVLNLRDAENCPIWLGETGENSNTWFTEVIELCEKNNIGWSMWPVKKTGINNIMTANTNSDYIAMLDGWKNNNYINADRAYKGVMKFAEDHHITNCKINYDVIDAMIDRPFRQGTLPYKKRSITDIIYAVDYDLGSNGEAYYDNDDVNYHLNTNSYTTWNRGWVYRNDGVDIEECSDVRTNGYCVSFVEDGEWLQYTATSGSNKSYAMALRYASNGTNALMYILVNGKRVSKTISLSSTGGWATWKTISIPNIIIPEGEVNVKLVFEKGDANINYFQLVNPKDISTAPFEALDFSTDTIRNIIEVSVSKDINSIDPSTFEAFINGTSMPIINTSIDTDNQRLAKLMIEANILPEDQIALTYLGNGCMSDEVDLSQFNKSSVRNKTLDYHQISNKIKAEHFIENSGFEFEDCNDEGGGKNSSYADKGDYLDYLVNVDQKGEYDVSFRSAVNNSSAMIRIHRVSLVDDETTFLTGVRLPGTGGWQNWQTQNSKLTLEKGKNRIRIEAYTDGFNLNWWRIDSFLSGIKQSIDQETSITYDKDTGSIFFNNDNNEKIIITIYDLSGKRIMCMSTYHNSISISNLSNGLYLLNFKYERYALSQKIIVNNNI